MTSVKIIPRLDKPNSEKKVPLYLRITKNRKSQTAFLDVFIQPDEWNRKTGKIKASAVNAKSINNYLAAKIATAEAISLDLETKFSLVSAKDIKAKFVGKKPIDFFEFVKLRAAIREKEYSIGSIRRYKCVVAKLKKYWGKSILYFDEIDVALIKGFQTHLLVDCMNHVNTVNANLKVIRKLINDAIAEELMSVDRNPFNKIKIKGLPSTRNYLLDDELKKLEELELPKYSQMNHHRNLYVFSAYACGIRIADLLMMRWQSFEKDRLTFQIRKNQQPLGIKLPSKALKIISFYREYYETRYGKVNIDPNAFIFPLLRIENKETDRVKIHNAISSATSYTNKDLRKLKKLAKLTKHITFHTARHSWAVRALHKGVRIEHVSKLMGHASVKQTETYAKILDTDLDKAMEVFDK